MLKLSTKGRYGLRAMIDLAEAYGDGPVLMGDISERQGFSRKYLHALLTSLKHAGLVQSVRGAKGGYMLSRKPQKIRVSEVFEALEGSLSIVQCVEDENQCSRIDDCMAREMWKDVNDAIAKVLTKKTLADLVQ